MIFAILPQAQAESPLVRLIATIGVSLASIKQAWSARDQKATGPSRATVSAVRRRATRGDPGELGRVRTSP